MGAVVRHERHWQFRPGNTGSCNAQTNSTTPSTTTTDSIDSPAPADMPTRPWKDGSGTVAVKGQYVGLLDGNVAVRDRDGRIKLLPLENLSGSDQQYVAALNGTSQDGSSAADLARN